MGVNHEYSQVHVLSSSIRSILLSRQVILCLLFLSSEGHVEPSFLVALKALTPLSVSINTLTGLLTPAMDCVAMKISIVGLFCLNIWSSFTSASAASASFDLCGTNEFSGENFTLSLNFSAQNAMKTGGECSRVILLKSSRIKLTVEELDLVSGAELEIQDGPGMNKGEKIGPKDGSELPSSYVSSSNAMVIRFKDDSQGAKGSSIFRGKISSEPFQDTCHCRGVKNGKLECSETEGQRRCQVKCDPSHMELSINQDVTCDLVKGEWDIDVHSMRLDCQKVQNPLKIKTTVNFNYANLACQHVDHEKVANVFRAYIAKSGVSTKGVCFSPRGDENSDCTQKRLQVNCTTNSNSADTVVTIIDRITEPATLQDANTKLQELYTAYSNLKLKGVLDSGDLDMKKANDSFAVDKESFANMTTPWCDSEYDYIKVPGNGTSFVCSTCPLHHLYNATTHTCQKCPSGSFAASRARSCIQKNGTAIPTSIKSKCDNKCMKGKRVDAKSWMCEWCPRNTYQNSSTKFNPDCTPCPGEKKTIFPGAQDVSECRDPCLSGAFVNTSSGTCQDCPVGTYMDVEKHAFSRCKMCEMGKITRGAGSKASSDCYKCMPGHFYNSSSTMCSPCPKGKYQDEMNKDTCKDCPSGTITTEFGSTSASECVLVCGMGKFLNDSKGMCFDCPKNTYQDLEQHHKTECRPCGSNKITNATGQTDSAQCFLSCDKGWFLDNSVSQCKKCPKGQYQDQPGQAQCKQCPDGKRTTGEGQSNESACVDSAACGKGQFYDSSKKICTPCPYGTYQEAENHLDNCKMCPSKKTSVKEGADDAKQCTAIDEKGKLEAFKMSLKFTSLSWSEELKDKNSVKYNETKTKIENAITSELHRDPSFEGVKVTDLRNGSIVADFELYFNDKVDYVPGKALQVAAQSGQVGVLSVSPESLKILQQDCSQPLGMESGKIENDQITASSHTNHYEPYEGRLHINGGRGWHAEFTRMIEYLQIDFKREVNITAVATQGQADENRYVKEYKLNMSDDGQIWNEYTENGKTKVTVAKYILLFQFPDLTTTHSFS